MARARARARATRTENSVVGDPEPFTSLAGAATPTASQQNWLAAALGAVAVEEERAGAPVNVQLDWLSVAILQQQALTSNLTESADDDLSASGRHSQSSRTPPRPIWRSPRPQVPSMRGCSANGVLQPSSTATMQF